MITVGMNYHVLEGKQQLFEDKFAGVIDALKAADGHESSNLWKDVSDDASYMITSEWSDEQAFKDFIQSDAFRAVTNVGQRANPVRPTTTTRFTNTKSKSLLLTHSAEPQCHPCQTVLQAGR